MYVCMISPLRVLVNRTLVTMSAANDILLHVCY